MEDRAYYTLLTSLREGSGQLHLVDWISNTPASEQGKHILCTLLDSELNLVDLHVMSC